MGNGKKGAEASAMINPVNGDLVVSKGEMKAIALKYCKDTLANNEPEKEFKELIEAKKTSVESLLTLKGGSFKTSITTFKKNIKKFSQSRKRSYDFLTKAGKDFQFCVFKMCEKMFHEEMFPT